MLPPRSASCVGAAHDLYGRILDRIEAKGYDVFAGRARVPTPMKLAVVARHLDPVDDPASDGPRPGRPRPRWSPSRSPRRGERGRRWISNVVVVGLSVTTTMLAGRRWGWPRSVAAAGVVAAGTLAVERIGTGVPFGRYEYTGRLQPAVAGVPVAVPLAWWGMAVPAREVAHAALVHQSTPGRRIVLGAVALTAWDLFLDPQMTGEGYWRWPGGGRYRGIPLTTTPAGWRRARR